MEDNEDLEDLKGSKVDKATLAQIKHMMKGYVARMEKIDKSISGYLKKVEFQCGRIKEQLEKQTALLKTLEKAQVSAESTFCHVLLAIRQNEYLQAWYPKKGPPSFPIKPDRNASV